MDWDVIQQWLEVLDSLSYYDLLRVPPSASADDVRVAFHAFARDFHPDAHAGRPRYEREAIGLVFKRGNEAYRVLSSAALRARYDAALLEGDVRPLALLSAPPPAESAFPAPMRPDRMRNPSARPFVLRAEELFKKGDPKQAKIQVTLALHMDPENSALEAFLKDIEKEVTRRNEAEKKKWQRDT